MRVHNAMRAMFVRENMCETEVILLWVYMVYYLRHIFPHGTRNIRKILCHASELDCVFVFSCVLAASCVIHNRKPEKRDIGFPMLGLTLSE